MDLDLTENICTVTANGDKKIYNGVTDWVYEEEVFGTDNALWFNPDGSKLVFGFFDDTEVKNASYFVYNEIKYTDNGQIQGQYPERIELNYPKVGTPNPSVMVKVFDVSNCQAEKLEISPPTDLDEPILGSIGFSAGSESVNIMWLNRRQNKMTIRLYNLDNSDENIEVKKISFAKFIFYFFRVYFPDF